MERHQVRDWTKAHGWWIALVLIVIAGYSIGKDLALRDNRQAPVQTAEAV